MKTYSDTNLSISIRKEDRVYIDMLKAVTLFYKSRGIEEKGNMSRLVIALLSKEVENMLEEIKRKYKVDALEIYREYYEQRTSPIDFFGRKLNRREVLEDMMEKKMEEVENG